MSGDTLVLKPVLVLARKGSGLTGILDHRVVIPPGVTRVLFGREEHEIWVADNTSFSTGL